MKKQICWILFILSLVTNSKAQDNTPPTKEYMLGFVKEINENFKKLGREFVNIDKNHEEIYNRISVIIQAKPEEINELEVYKKNVKSFLKILNDFPKAREGFDFLMKEVYNGYNFADKDSAYANKFFHDNKTNYEYNFVGVVSGIDVNLLGINKQAFNFWRENKNNPEILKTFNARETHAVAKSDIIPIISAELLSFTKKYDPSK